MSKFGNIFIMTMILSVGSWFTFFMVGTFICGIEWAFTDIDYNRLVQWFDEDWKNPVKTYYLCLLLSFPASVYKFKGDK